MSASIELCAVNIAKTSQAICSGVQIFFFIVFSFIPSVVSFNGMVISRFRARDWRGNARKQAVGLVRGACLRARRRSGQPDIQRRLDILFIFPTQ